MLILSLILYRFHIKKIKSELILSFGQIILKALMSFDRTIIKRQPHGGMICVLTLMKALILDATIGYTFPCHFRTPCHFYFTDLILV